MIYLRSALFNAGMVLLLLCFVLPSPLLWPFPFRVRYAFLSGWARLVLRWLKLTCNISHQVEGWEHIPQGTAIVFSKHQSSWETLALQTILPPQTWVLKRELLWLPVFGWGLAALKPVAIDRAAGRKALEQVVRQGKQRLDEGIWLIIFPEGTRVAPGERRRYAAGGAMLAKHSGYPVLPIAHNAGEHWGKRAFLKHPGTIRLVIGPLIDTQGKSVQQINAEAEAWIERKCGEISRLPPPAEAPARVDGA